MLVMSAYINFGQKEGMLISRVFISEHMVCTYNVRPHATHCRLDVLSILSVKVSAAKPPWIAFILVSGRRECTIYSLSILGKARPTLISAMGMSLA